MKKMKNRNDDKNKNDTDKWWEMMIMIKNMGQH